MNTSIQTDLKEAIQAAHNEAELATHEARQGVDGAINKRVTAAALVEKASRMHKQHLRGYLSNIMTGEQVKAYLSLHDAAKKRPALEDKRQLHLCGILDVQAERTTASGAKPTPTFIGATAKFMARVNKTLRTRPVKDWGDSEREQFVDVIEPMVDIYRQIKGNSPTPYKESLSSER